MTTPREIEVTLGKGVSATLAIPHAVDEPDFLAKGFAAPTLKCALILHGQGGHRNYCYQKQLAYRLASDLGYYSLRIDFRGCGSSADNADEKEGRRIYQDIEDIRHSIEFLTDGTKNPLGFGLTLDAVVSHSRGSVAAFLWLKEENSKVRAGDPTAVSVPNVINCAARYNSPTVYDRYKLHDGDFENGVPQTMLRHGKFQDVIISKNELVDLAVADLSELEEISTDTSVLSIYGSHDAMIPINDSACYANVLNRGPLTHELLLVEHADHNFIGTYEIEDEDDAALHNPKNLPLKGKNVNFNPVVVNKIVDYLSPDNQARRFYAASKYVGHTTRWKTVDGVSNFRDIGGWRLLHPTFPQSAAPHIDYYFKPNLVYRSAIFSNVTEQGLRTMQKLGITTVFDLRSESECKRDSIPQGLEKYGITRVSVPLYGQADYSPQTLATRYSNLMTSWSTFITVYEEMLKSGVGAFKTIFEFIRDNADTPFMVHCTAGKDRTGVICMLILLLGGLDPITVAREYELTSEGLKPEHKSIKKVFRGTMDKMRAKVGDGIEARLAKGREGWTLDKDGFASLISSRSDAMLQTIDRFNIMYGGVVSYMENQLGFSKDDVLKIYNNLVTRDHVDNFSGHSINEWSHVKRFRPNL